MLENILVVVAAVERLVEYLFVPLFDKFGWGRDWIKYVVWLGCAVLVFLMGVDLFPYFPDYAWAGQVLTAAVAGCGAQALHKFIK